MLYYISMPKQRDGFKDNGQIKTNSESNHKFMPPLEDVSDVEYPVDGEPGVAKRSLSVQIKAS